MKLNSKLTWGLAWAGLAVIVAVPSADFLTGKMGADGGKALLTSTTEPVTPGAAPALPAAPVKTASVVTSTITPNGVTITPAGSPLPTDPVSKYIVKNKALPDYISGGTSAQAKPADTTSSVEPPTQVATVEQPPVVAPTPFPSWARPHDVAKPEVPASPTAPVVIVDENALATQQDDTTPDVATLDPNRPTPPAGIADDPQGGWKSRSLTTYLDQQGLLNEGSADGRSSASVTIVKRPSNYDPDGFYLSDGPNSERAARRAARLRALFGDDYVDDGSDQPPDQLNVF